MLYPGMVSALKGPRKTDGAGPGGISSHPRKERGHQLHSSAPAPRFCLEGSINRNKDSIGRTQAQTGHSTSRDFVLNHGRSPLSLGIHTLRGVGGDSVGEGR